MAGNIDGGDRVIGTTTAPAKSSCPDTVMQYLMKPPGRNDPETVKLTGIHHNLIRSWYEHFARRVNPELLYCNNGNG
jgi:hypothetical protein